ncbi:acetoacetate decarboxylase family protein [Thermopolyspora sp. NPDC052614]|uniref:acetoacetate decarboxylase family protein n=1 Tax=Thermopolyspora sp. NPDC052614 TaxID=3155682 RepID=UPI0034375537
MARHIIQGRELVMPVEIRDATVCGATYLVRADAARAVLAYSGMDVTEVLPGKAICVLGFVRYHDGDLGAYNEFCVAFLVRPPEGGRPPARSPLAGPRDLRQVGAGAFVHWLPVDQGFTLEAGRAIWGFPKELADVDLRLDSPYKRCILRRDGRLVLDMLIRPGIPLPPPAVLPPVTLPRVDAFTHLDDVTRRTRWTVGASGVRLRPGGALIRLGNHPIAKELSELGLPKTALLSGTARHVRMSIEDAAPAAR